MTYHICFYSIIGWPLYCLFNIVDNSLSYRYFGKGYVFTLLESKSNTKMPKYWRLDNMKPEPS